MEEEEKKTILLKETKAKGWPENAYEIYNEIGQSAEIPHKAGGDY